MAKETVGKRKDAQGRVARGGCKANICSDPCDQELSPCLRPLSQMFSSNTGFHSGF